MGFGYKCFTPRHDSRKRRNGYVTALYVAMAADVSAGTNRFRQGIMRLHDKTLTEAHRSLCKP